MMADESKALDEAAKLAAPFEGFVPHPYQDSAGVWTIGYGTTRDESGIAITAETPPISNAQALVLFERDLRAALATVARDVIVPLTDEEEAALVDFVYNLGAGNFARSTLLRLLNAGNYDAAADQFDLWNRAGGRVLAGLVRRRAAERKLFEG